MKKLFSVISSILILSVLLCACKKDDAAKKVKVPEFNAVAVDYVSAFNQACPESLEKIGALDAADKVDENTNYAQHAFDEYTSVILFTTPETNKLQKTLLWLMPQGMDKKDSVYNFAAYTKIMLSTFVSDESELNKAIESLRLSEELAYGYQNTYENDYMIAYYSHDNTGLKLLVLPIAAKYSGEDLLPPAPESGTVSKVAASE